MERKKKRFGSEFATQPLLIPDFNVQKVRKTGTTLGMEFIAEHKFH